MKAPKNLKYTNTHEWLEIDGSVAIIGITDHAQDALGDIVFIDLPQIGDEVICGESFADVESVKAVSEVISPVSGTIIEVNEELLDSPEKVNEDAYGSWFIKVGDITEQEADDMLYDENEYKEIIKSNE